MLALRFALAASPLELDSPEDKGPEVLGGGDRKEVAASVDYSTALSRQNSLQRTAKCPSRRVAGLV